jgi:predicted dehydrogenase
VLKKEKLGKIFMVKCDVLWNRYNDYYTRSDWRGDVKKEGGALFTQASHFIDLMVWLFGEISSSKTKTQTLNHPIEIEDCGTALLNFKSGVMGALSWTTCVYNKNYEGSITIIGEHGTIKVGGLYLNKIEYWDVRGHPLDNTISFSDKPNVYSNYQGTSSNHDHVIKNVIAKLKNEDNDIVDGYEGLKTIRAIETLYAGLE